MASPTVLMATISGYVRQLDCTDRRTLNCPSHPVAGVEIDFVAAAASGVAITCGHAAGGGPDADRYPRRPADV